MDIQRQMQSIAELKDGWADENSRPFSEKLIDICLNYLSVLPEPTGVFPTLRGTIQFEWEYPNKDYLEFEIDEDSVSVLKVLGRDYENAVSLVVSALDIDILFDIANRFWSEH